MKVLPVTQHTEQNIISQPFTIATEYEFILFLSTPQI